MIATILLQATTGFDSRMLITLGGCVIVFYFFMIRPQAKKAKDQKKFVSDLKKGDKVVTTAGLHGRIAEVSDTTFVLETEGGHKLRHNKSAISLEESRVLNNPPAAKS